MMTILMWGLLCAYALPLVQSQDHALKVTLTSDEPALTFAPIGFYAHLQGVAENSTDLYTYVWRCLDAGIKMRIENQTTACNITPSVLERGVYRMNLAVELNGKTMAEASLMFNIRNDLIGEIKIVQPGIVPRGPRYVASDTPSNITLELHDPRNFLADFELSYSWSSNFLPISVQPQCSYNFTGPDREFIITLTVTALRKYPSFLLYLGSYGVSLQSRDPVLRINTSGNTEMQHGDLLELEIACDGSPPFSYCWRFARGDVNASTETCKSPTMTTTCDIFVVHYFQKSGNYKLVSVIENDLNQKVSVININVFDSAPLPQLSTILVPLVCSVLALVVVVGGIAYYVSARHSHTIEVADFDFQQSENFEYRTFLERLTVSFDCLRFRFGEGESRPPQTNGYRKIPAQIT